MKLFKPHWVHHDEKPIFSVDIHQDCQRFATGGQGLDAGRVVIWNLLPVLSEKADSDESVPKMLCQMENHVACVNCVRWSNNGQMLASGSDDKLVMIWKIAKGSSGVFGTGGLAKNHENWKCTATLRGHSGDVLDLAWSPQDRWLASCSVDNTIIIWDVQAFPAMVAMLRGHTGLVKGVSWDPVGKFLSSQSDDRSVKIWKTSDWSCDHTITEPFEECGGTTHILRLSWSPDGQYLVSAHAMNGGGPTAQIIERDGWKCDKDFVGHRKAVTCVRFHNSILKRPATTTAKAQQCCCLAMGSRDRALSVWMTALQRPLVVIHDLFRESVLDLSWGTQESILMACSSDGTVACLQFERDELGALMSEVEKNSLYQRIYGKSVLFENGANSAADILIENPELLNISQEKMKPPSLPVIKITNHNNNFLESTGTLPTNGFSMKFSTQPAKSNNNCNSISSGRETTASQTIHKTTKQIVSRTADGKKRITPVFIPPNQGDVETNVNTFTEVNMQPKDSIQQSNETSVSVASNGGVALFATNHTNDAATLNAEEKTHLDSRMIKIANPDALVQPQARNQNDVKSFPTQSLRKPATSQLTDRLQPPNAYQATTVGPKLSININTKCEFQKTALEHRVHVHNGNVQTATGLLAKVTGYALHMGKKLWEVFVGSPIVNLNFCRKYVMLCSLDGTLRLLNMQTGCVVLPLITLGSTAVQCAFCPTGQLVGVISECGILRIWNINKECISLAITCSDSFKLFGAVVQFYITENGVPLVLLANGNSYTYSEKLQTWLVVNGNDPIMRHGVETTIPKEFQKNFKLYPLTSVQASSNSFGRSNNELDLNQNDWQSCAKIAYIENQIKLSEAINSPEELKHWYNMLAYYLALSGSETRIRLLLDDLLGSDFGFSKWVASDERRILSIPKHILLESVLNVLKTHVKWQRIYMEYNELFQDSQRKKNLPISRTALDIEMFNANSKGDSMDTT